MSTHMPPQTIALYTEGTYPQAHGGVSVWVDQLVRGLDDHRFVVQAISGIPFAKAAVQMPGNVSFTQVPLWGAPPSALIRNDAARRRGAEDAYLTVLNGLCMLDLDLFAAGLQAYHLEVNPQWGSVKVDARNPAWWTELLRRGDLELQNADGLMLDTLDTAGTEATLALVQTLRTAFPKATLLANRGFGLLPGLARLVDGVLFEGFSTTHTPAYAALDKQGRTYTAHWLKELRAQGLSVCALDYTDTPGLARAARARAAQYNVQTFVTNRALSLAGGFP